MEYNVLVILKFLRLVILKYDYESIEWNEHGRNPDMLKIQ